MIRRLTRVGPGHYETPDGRFEVVHDVHYLEGECECAVCQEYINGRCPNDGFGKREGWHIWDRQADDYAAFAPEPEQFARFHDARRCLVERGLLG